MARIKVAVRTLAGAASSSSRSTGAESSSSRSTGAELAFVRDIVDDEDGAIIRISARPKSSREVLEIAESGFTLKIRAPPVDGQANVRILEVLASLLDTAKRSLSIKSGETGRHKAIMVQGLDAATVRARIRAHLES